MHGSPWQRRDSVATRWSSVLDHFTVNEHRMLDVTDTHVVAAPPFR
jgi:hypothetical protein